jgi:hypothetical protein
MFRSKWLKIKNDVAQYLTQYSKTKKATSDLPQLYVAISLSMQRRSIKDQQELNIF